MIHMWKKKLTERKEKIFQWINTILVVGIVLFYGIRFCYFYQRNKKIYDMPAYSTFNSVLIDRMDKSSADRLYEMEDGSFVFKGKVTDNYCLYDNNLYRIVGINCNGTVFLVSENSVTSMVMNCEEALNDSYLYQWLNVTDQPNSGVFEKTLNEDEEEPDLTFSMAFYGRLNDLSGIINDSPFTDGKITLLSMLDYANSGGKDSFLNNGEMFWLSNQDSEGHYYYVCEDGSVSSGYPDQQLCGIRPVITLKSTLVVETGDGRHNNPYVIKATEISSVSDLSCGSYVQYSGLKWRITTCDEIGTQAILDGVIMDDNGPLEMTYGNTTRFSLNDGVGKYLNNTFLSSLSDYKDYLVEHNAYYGEIHNDGYSYLNDYDSFVKCYVSLPTMGTFFLNEQHNYHLSVYEGDLFTLMVKDGFIYQNVLSQKACLRPVICFNNDLKVIAGSGGSEEPYILGLGGTD